MKKIIRLKVDSRDEHAHEYGQVSTFTDESNFGVGVPLTIESLGGIYCTALASCKAGTSQTKNEYFVDDLWNDTPHSVFGADPRDTLSTMVKEGLKRTKDGVIDKIWNGYFRGDTGPLDSFDNCRSAMTIAQSSIEVCTPWYDNWDRLQGLEVMPQGDVQVSNHAWDVLDWKIINGVTMFVIDAHQGYTLLMPREVFNMTMSKLGSVAYVPSTQAIESVRTRNIFEWISDQIANIRLILQSIQLQIFNIKK